MGNFASMRAVSIDFLQSAPWKFVNVVEINATPEAVFQVLLNDNAWQQWHPEVSHVVWETNKPHKVGSKRSVRFTHWLLSLLLLGSLTIYEEFLVWEDNHRFAFRFNATNRPTCLGYRAAMEDFQVERLPNGNTKFTRTVAVEPSFITSVLSFVLKPTFHGIFQRASQNLAQQFADKKFT